MAEKECQFKLGNGFPLKAPDSSIATAGNCLTPRLNRHRIFQDDTITHSTILASSTKKGIRCQLSPIQFRLGSAITTQIQKNKPLTDTRRSLIAQKKGRGYGLLIQVENEHVALAMRACIPMTAYKAYCTFEHLEV